MFTTCGTMHRRCCLQAIKFVIFASFLLLLLLLLQFALQPLVGFGLLYEFVSQSSIFTLAYLLHGAESFLSS